MKTQYFYLELGRNTFLRKLSREEQEKILLTFESKRREIVERLTTKGEKFVKYSIGDHEVRFDCQLPTAKAVGF